MYTLIYYNGQFNRPDTLLPFLESNVGETPFLQIDCVTPYQGTVEGLIQEACHYLNGIDSHIAVNHQEILSKSTDTCAGKTIVKYLSIQLQVSRAD